MASDGRCSGRKRQGRTYGRKTAYLATKEGVLRLRLAPWGMMMEGKHWAEVTPYNGGFKPRYVPLHDLRRKREQAEYDMAPAFRWRLKGWQDYPLA